MPSSCSFMYIGEKYSSVQKDIYTYLFKKNSSTVKFTHIIVPSKKKKKKLAVKICSLCTIFLCPLLSFYFGCN